jgi:bacillithiol synthase
VPSRPPATPTFIDTYLCGELADAFEVAPGDVDAALATPRPHDRARLAEVLRRRHHAWGMGDVAARSLQRLAHPEARVVVTGQQIGWLLGPTFTLSKAVTAINLARRLDRPERPVVPLFWMATQDHDVEEMDHAWVLGRDERLERLSLAVDSGPAVGRSRLRATDVARARTALRALDGDGPHAADVDDLLAEACEGSRAWSDGFAKLLLRLLGGAGLLVVDPLDPEVAQLWRAALERELDDPGASSQGIVAAGRRLAERGFSPLLGRGDDASNLFVEAPGGGPRTLLRHRAGTLSLGGERVERATLRAYLDDDPTSVTPAAGLRPVLQDLALPTAAFVVGPGELRYLAQLRPVYERHDVAMPLVWPRASVTVLQPPVRRILERHGLDWRAVSADPERAMSELLLRQHGYADAAAVALGDVEKAFDALLRATDDLDPTLTRAVARGRRHLDRTVVGLREKVARALMRRDDDLQRQFQRLRAHLRPNGGHQERVLSPFSFFLTLGVDAVTDAFLGLEPEGHQLVRF